ncbi:prephenate dehydratase [Blastomonas natatoria]|uniref:prephenate dehydratase n=1 Tax=Blastomonas natatoria TaxID=34015 RepID=A0A2V3V298_9SPHN|nr:prephenate dehydratase [Blastomonas natatoria]PXW75204.1 prephenate dehydratase [Blastomonas natatoria]
MQSYPEIARRMVEDMARIAAAEPERSIAYQGAPGAYSHIAARAFAPDWHPLPCFSFQDAMDAVKDGRAARAIIPIENSQHGRVADIHFLLPESGLTIVAEYFLPVRHCLLAKDAGPYTAAVSHPQALGQTRHYLRAQGIEPITYPDTAGAAAFVAESGEPGLCAVASRLAGEVFGLKVVAEGIEDAAHNMTRFVVLAAHRDDPMPDVPKVMTTFIFEVKNIPAALFMALSGFATNGINMTKLESYIRDGSFSAAEFYADIEGMPGQPGVDRALEVLGYHSKWVRILGSYPQAMSRE